MKIAYGLVALLLLISCSRGTPQPAADLDPSATAPDATGAAAVEMAPGSATETPTVTLDPALPKRGDTVRLVASGLDRSTAGYGWWVNNNPFPAAAGMDQFDTHRVRKGDRLQAVVTTPAGELRSDPVLIQNSPPELTRAALMRETGNTLSVDAAAADADDDTVEIRYDWTQDGAPAGRAPRFSGTFTRGTKIAVTVTPFDGTDSGPAVTLDREVVNRSPVITRDDAYTFDGTHFTHMIKATDPDGDALTFALKAAPAGMTIDAAAGLIQWDVPPAVSGKVAIKVAVRDGKGGTAEQELTFTLDAPAAAAKATESEARR